MKPFKGACGPKNLRAPILESKMVMTRECCVGPKSLSSVPDVGQRHAKDLSKLAYAGKLY